MSDLSAQHCSLREPPATEPSLDKQAFAYDYHFGDTIPYSKSSYPYSPMDSSASSSHTPSLSIDSTVTSSVSSDDYRRKRPRTDHQADPLLLIEAENEASMTFSELAEAIRLVDNDATKGSSKTSGRRTSKQITALRRRRHQIFAIIMLMRNVQLKDTAVCLRNCIYNRYSAICKENGISPICNSSFGKLVRLVFPTTTARRLGIRGSSRYHYCGLKLIADAKYDSMDKDADSSTEVIPKYPTISFSTLESLPHFDDSIELYIDGPIDPQFQAFAEWYAKLCKSSFQNLRYMKIKTLFEEMSQYKVTGELARYLENNRELATNFTDRCDLELMRCSVSLLSKVAFQNVPDSVRTQIDNLDEHLIEFAHQMQIPDFLFARKLDRLTKFTKVVATVNRVIGYAASVALNMSDPNTRSNILKDWIDLDIEEILERNLVLSDKDKETVGSFLKNDITRLLSRLENVDSGNATIHATSIFLASVPAKFHVKPRHFLLSMNTVMAAILRQVTSDSTAGFATWWNINCWVCEFFNLLAELGGFAKENQFSEK